MLVPYRAIPQPEIEAHAIVLRFHCLSHVYMLLGLKPLHSCNRLAGLAARRSKEGRVSQSKIRTCCTVIDAAKILAQRYERVGLIQLWCVRHIEKSPQVCGWVDSALVSFCSVVPLTRPVPLQGTRRKLTTKLPKHCDPGHVINVKK